MTRISKDEKFGRWVVIRSASRDGMGRARVVVRCACGTEAIVLENALARGNTRGCRSVLCRKSWEAAHGQGAAGDGS